MLRVQALCVFLLVLSSCHYLSDTATANIKFKFDTSFTENLKNKAKYSVSSSIDNWKAYHDQDEFGVETDDGVIYAWTSMYPSDSVEVRGTSVTYRLYYSEIPMKWKFEEWHTWLFGVPYYWGMGYRYFKIRGVSVTVEHRVSARKSSNNEISMTASTYPTVDWSYQSCVSTGCSEEGCDWSLTESTYCRMLMSHIKDNLSRSMRYQLNNRINSKILKLKDGMPSKYTYGSALHTLPGAFGNTYSVRNAYWDVELKQYNGNIYVLATFSSESNPVKTEPVTSDYDVEWTYGSLDLSQLFPLLRNELHSVEIRNEEVSKLWKKSQIVASIDGYLFNIDISLDHLQLITTPGNEHANVTLLVSESLPLKNKLGETPHFMKIHEFKPQYASLILPIAMRPSVSECKISATVLELDVELVDLTSSLQVIGTSQKAFEDMLKRNVLDLSAYISSLDIGSDCVTIMKKWSSHFKNAKLQLENVRGSIFNLKYAANY